jgi:hypothetical protein
MNLAPVGGAPAGKGAPKKEAKKEPKKEAKKGAKSDAVSGDTLALNVWKISPQTASIPPESSV